MSDALSTFARFSGAYAATVAIGLVCAYLGLFTVLRRIVFTGVALAQLAAAGVAGAFFLADAAWLPSWISGPAGRWGATIGSLGLALAGALGLHARPAQKRVTPDALVGFAYAAASAIAVLLVWRSAQGLAELHDILAGEVLLSRSRDLTSLWVGLVAVALVQARFRREFLLVSFDPEFARALRLPERRLQLLFLGSLAVAVAVSLKAAGLLLVFSFLVLPPMTGLLAGAGLPQATLLALATAVGSSLLGFLGAILLDLPVAPSVATTQVLLFGIAWAGRRRPGAQRAARGLLGGLGALGLAALPLAWLGAPRAPAPPPPPPLPVTEPRPDDHGHTGADDLHRLLHELAAGATPEAREAAAVRLGEEGDAGAMDALVHALEDEDEHVRDIAAQAVEALVTRLPAARERLHVLANDADHAELRTLTAMALWRLGDPRAVEVYVRALGDERVPVMLRSRAIDRLRELNGGDALGYDPFADAAANARPVKAWRAWWQRTHERLAWDREARTFRVR